MNWLFIVLAGFFEVVWIYSLKSTAGFTRFLPLIPYAVCGLGTSICLSQSLKSIPIGVAYSLWTGVAVAGCNLIGLMVEHQPFQAARLFFIALILCGIIGLHVYYPGS